MPVEITPTKKMPSKRLSCARRARYCACESSVMAQVYLHRQQSLAIFGHRSETAAVSENGRCSLINRATMTIMETLSGTIVLSPVGQLHLVASDRGLVAVLWENDNPTRVRLPQIREDCGTNPYLGQAELELWEYFAGRRTAFSVRLDFRGTEFQRQAWSALLTIPFGETRSYAQMARQIGRPAAVRALGAANGRNPVSIIVPCHRVVGSDGSLTGFAGG